MEYIALGLFGGGLFLLGVFVYLVVTAPHGHEDDEGFHYDD